MNEKEYKEYCSQVMNYIKNNSVPEGANINSLVSTLLRLDEYQQGNLVYLIDNELPMNSYPYIVSSKAYRMHLSGVF